LDRIDLVCVFVEKIFELDLIVVSGNSYYCFVFEYRVENI